MTVSHDVRTDRHSLTAEGSVELAVLDRNGFDESRHVGAGVVVAADGTVLDAVGEHEAPGVDRAAVLDDLGLADDRLELT